MIILPKVQLHMIMFNKETIIVQTAILLYYT